MVEATPLDREILDFLKDQLPIADEKALIEAFSRVFSKDFGDDFVKAADWNRDKNLLQLAINALEKAKSRIDALPVGVKDRLDAEHQRDIIGIENVSQFLADQRELGKTYYKYWLETGGRDPLANLIADAVHLALLDLGVTPTFGTRGDDSAAPSTAYCRIVQRALKYHGIKVDWRSPAKRIFKTYRQ